MNLAGNARPLTLVRTVLTDRMSATAPILYSVLLPVYNERDNLPLMIAMLDKAFTEKWVADILAGG